MVASGTDSKGGMDHVESARKPVTPVGIVGAGIVGLAVARQLAGAGVPVVVFEKEQAVAATRPATTPGSCTPEFTTPLARPRRHCAAAASACSARTAPTRADL